MRLTFASTWHAIALGLTLCLLTGAEASAQTDEIQVYTGEINAPGELSLTLHNNYIAVGRKRAEFAGGVRPDGSLNGVTELGYGVADWLELGAYMPFLYSVTHDGRFLLNGAKLRALAVVPNAKERTFFYGLNFELSYNARHWATERIGTELRPIVGVHLGRWDLIANPIVDIPVGRNMGVDVNPAERVAFNPSETWAIALEHYSSYGRAFRFDPVRRQDHTGFIVVDYAAPIAEIEFGVGHGFTAAGDMLVMKLMVTRSF